jgi:hypothetical protein
VEDEEADGDDDEGEVDSVLTPLLLPLLLSLLLPPTSLSCGKLLLLSPSCSTPPSSLSVTLPKRSTISLVVVLGEVFCPNTLGILPPTTMNSSSSSNNCNDTEIFRRFIDILHTVVLTRKVLEILIVMKATSRAISRVLFSDE